MFPDYIFISISNSSAVEAHVSCRNDSSACIAVVTCSLCRTYIGLQVHVYWLAIP